MGGELPRWCGHCVCSGSPSSAAGAALQLCKEHLEVCPGCVGVPCGARASSSLALAVGAAQEAPATGRQHLQPSHCALPVGEGFIQGGRGTLHHPRAALPANISPLCPWAEPELNISTLKLSENSP